LNDNIIPGIIIENKNIKNKDKFTVNSYPLKVNFDCPKTMIKATKIYKFIANFTEIFKLVPYLKIKLPDNKPFFN
jgi:hypothetical protein